MSAFRNRHQPHKDDHFRMLTAPEQAKPGETTISQDDVGVGGCSDSHPLLSSTAANWPGPGSASENRDATPLRASPKGPPLGPTNTVSERAAPWTTWAQQEWRPWDWTQNTGRRPPHKHWAASGSPPAGHEVSGGRQETGWEF